MCTGNAVLTPGFNLTARFVIHTVGPVWIDGEQGERECLEATYRAAFSAALGEPKIRSLAFPCISTAAYRFPKDEAAQIALAQLHQHGALFDRVVACVFEAEDVIIYERLIGKLR